MIDPQTALRAFLAGGLVLAAAPAFAQEGALFQNFARSLNLFGTEKPDIDYRERPPLVVPPASTLPRPVDAGTTRNAAWPKDPDVEAKKAAKAYDLMPATEREKYKDNQRPLLSQEELRRGRVAGDGGPRYNAAEGTNNSTYENNIRPIQIGRELAARQAETDLRNLTYGSEPRRQYLYEPPAGYRMPAGSAPVGPGADEPRVNSGGTQQREYAQGLIPR